MRFHRSVARLAALSVTALGLGAGLAALGTPASAASGTFSSGTAVPIGRAAQTANGPGLTIPAFGPATPYPSTGTVDGLIGTVTDVNLTLTGYGHSFPWTST